MTTNYRHLKLDADFPGVTTTVTQTVDFGQLEAHQLRRCVRAVERGHAAHGGYVRGLVNAAANHLGVAPPVVVSDYYIGPLQQEKYGPAFAETIKLSDVRYQLWLSNNPNYANRVYWAQRKSGWVSKTQLALWGWRGDRAGLEAEVRRVLKTTDYYKDLHRLAEFIGTAPKFEVEK